MSELLDTACPVCGELPGLGGQQVGNRRYSAACVIFDERTLLWRPMTPEEHPPPPGEPSRPLGRPEKATDAWQRRLHDGGLEIMCKTPGMRMRVSGPDDWVWEMVEKFEERSGLRIAAENRPPRRRREIHGQMTMSELESEGNGGEN